MNIVLDNREFNYDLGCRLLKTKYKEEVFPGLEDVWEHIKPMTFEEIAKTIQNIEERRIAINCLGIEQLAKEVNPQLIDEQIISKETYWVDENGDLIRKRFKDKYQLYKVDGSKWSEGVETQRWNVPNNVYFVKCKDTSTDREYFIWVDVVSVYRTNYNPDYISSLEDYGRKINATQAIAWTIQTDVAEGGIEKIVRQGDCVFIKKNENATNCIVRHLTEKEYLKLLTAES